MRQRNYFIVGMICAILLVMWNVSTVVSKETLENLTFWFDGSPVTIDLPKGHGIPDSEWYDLDFWGQVSVDGEILPFKIFKISLNGQEVARVILHHKYPMVLSISTPAGVWIYKGGHDKPIPETGRDLEDFLLSLMGRNV